MVEDRKVRLYSVRESARLFGISVKTMWWLITERKIAVVKIKNKTLVPHKAMERFIRKNIRVLDGDSPTHGCDIVFK
jgi:hypothetical protein